MGKTDFKIPLGGHIEYLEGGRPAVPGEQVTLDDKEIALPGNKLLIDEGKLVALEPVKQPTKAELLERAADLDIEGRSKMSPDELRQAIAEAQHDQEVNA